MFMAETLEREVVNPGSKTVGSSSLIQYLREIGRTALLSASEEIELSREIRHARETLLRRVKRVPANCRRFVIEADGRELSPLEQRSIEELEACAERFVGYARTTGAAELRKPAEAMERGRRRLVEARDAMVRAR